MGITLGGIGEKQGWRLNTEVYEKPRKGKRAVRAVKPAGTVSPIVVWTVKKAVKLGESAWRLK